MINFFNEDNYNVFDLLYLIDFSFQIKLSAFFNKDT